MSNTEITIITLDGPSGVGKGTVSRLLAHQLGFHMLDSGALYRLTALAAINAHIDLDDETRLALLAAKLDIKFIAHDDITCIYLNDEDVTQDIRTEAVGIAASLVAPLKKVRDALLDRQRQFVKSPGLVADGRDMGTVVFETAPFKFYLTASSEERARRRILQLKKAGLEVDESAILGDIRARDDRDMNRAVAPLKPASDAIVLDTTNMSIEQVLDAILNHIRPSRLQQ